VNITLEYVTIYCGSLRKKLRILSVGVIKKTGIIETVNLGQTAGMVKRESGESE
jgi:hypothetical protein